MTIEGIHQVLKRLGGFGSHYIREFTYQSMRIDAAIIDMRSRWIRGFEIKVNRSDWLKDEKWMHYSEFVSSLSVVCPTELIKPEEVNKPFGLLWVEAAGSVRWVKKPKRFQRRDAMAWLYRYLEVIEAEFPRVVGECDRLRAELNYERTRKTEAA